MPADSPGRAGAGGHGKPYWFTTEEENLFPMFMPWLPTARRTPQGPRGSADAAATPESVPPHAPLDVSWEAIVAQLRATPAEGHANEPDPPEYEWARKLGVHINRPPRRSQK